MRRSPRLMAATASGRGKREVRASRFDTLHSLVDQMGKDAVQEAVRRMDDRGRGGNPVIDMDSQKKKVVHLRMARGDPQADTSVTLSIPNKEYTFVVAPCAAEAIVEELEGTQPEPGGTYKVMVRNTRRNHKMPLTLRVADLKKLSQLSKR